MVMTGGGFFIGIEATRFGIEEKTLPCSRHWENHHEYPVQRWNVQENAISTLKFGYFEQILRADHIPCQNSSEISQTCKNHIQATCRFHDVSQALFSSRTCIVDGKCSYQKKIFLSAQFWNDSPIWSRNTQNVVGQTIEYDDTPGVR